MKTPTGCAAFRPTSKSTEETHAKWHAFGIEHRMTITYAPWHSRPEYRMFATGSLLSRNEEFPSGLVLVWDDGTPVPYSA